VFDDFALDSDSTVNAALWFVYAIAVIAVAVF